MVFTVCVQCTGRDMGVVDWLDLTGICDGDLKM